MPYVDSTYYTATFKGTVVPTAELDSYLQRASDQIDQLTYFGIVKKGFTNLTAFQQVQIQNAVCSQADHLYQYKDILEGLKSFNAGDGQVSLDYKLFSSRALSYLIASGLRYRGLGGYVNEVSLYPYF